MKKKLLLSLCLAGMMATQVNAQGPGGFMNEMLYPMSGYVGPNLPQIDLVYGHNVAIQQIQDSIVQSQWHNVMKIETPKDANGRFTRSKMAQWDAVLNDWAPSIMNMEFTYTYNAQQKLTAYERLTHVNDTMIIKENMAYLNSGPNGSAIRGNALDSILTPSFAMLYATKVDSFVYSGNNLTNYTSYTIQGTPELAMKIVYTYTASNKVETIIHYEDDGSGNIGPNEKTVYTYDGSGNIAEAVYSIYDQGSSSFVNDEKDIFSYVTGTGRMSQQKTYGWNTGTSSFDLETTIDFHYNAGDLVDSAYETDANTPSNNSITLITYDASSKPELVLSHRFDGSQDERYIYTETPTTGLFEKTVVKAESSLYPNPTTGLLFIKNTAKGVSKIRIMDLTGKEVLYTETADGMLYATSLNKGIYFYSLSNDMQSENGKLIIE